MWPNAPRSAIPTAERSATNFPLSAYLNLQTAIRLIEQFALL